MAVYKGKINVIQVLIICSFAPRHAGNAKPTCILLQEILIALLFGFVFFSKLQFSGKKYIYCRKKTSQTRTVCGGRGGIKNKKERKKESNLYFVIKPDDSPLFCKVHCLVRTILFSW